jgi:putative lysine transport system permease protein
MSRIISYFNNTAGGPPGAAGSTADWVSYIAGQYKTMFFQAMLVTIYVALIGTILGFILGFLCGIVNSTKIDKEDNPVKKVLLRIVKVIVAIYVEVFRDTPMIVQGMVLYYGLRSNNIMVTSLAAGILVIALNTGAYMAETVRAGIYSVDPGQREGALAMGMSNFWAMFYVIVPQAIRNIVPEMCNTFLTNLKETSVLNVIGVTELFLMAKTAGGAYYKYYESYLVISVIYLVLCFLFNRVFKSLESRMKETKDYVLAAEYVDNGD